MREGWKLRSLGNVCDVFSGQSPPGSALNGEEKGLPFYQGKKEFTERYIGPPTTWTTELTKEAAAGDILMSVRAPVGPINYATQRICIGRGLAAIRAKSIDSGFLFYALLAKQSEIAGREGTVFPSINRDEIKAIQLPVPSRAEQQRIVAILDEAFEAIAAATANSEKNLANAEELFQRVRRQSLEGDDTWRARAFEDCLDRVSYTTKVHRRDFRATGRFPIISQEAEFINGWWDNPDDVFTVDRPIILFGDHTRIFKYVDFDFVLGADGVKILCPKGDIYPRFFYHLLSSLEIGEIGYARHYRILKERDVTFPDLASQQRVAATLDQLERQMIAFKELLVRKLTSLAELKQSFLARAFSGELTAGLSASPVPSLRAEGEAIQGGRAGSGSLRRYAPRDDGKEGASRDDGKEGAPRDDGGKGSSDGEEGRGGAAPAAATPPRAPA